MKRGAQAHIESLPKTMTALRTCLTGLLGDNGCSNLAKLLQHYNACPKLALDSKYSVLS